MRTFFRRYYTHSRFISATGAALDSLQLDTGSGSKLVSSAARRARCGLH